MRLKCEAAMQLLILLTAMSSLGSSNALPYIDDAVNIIKIIQEVSEGIFTAWQLIDSADFDNKLPFVLDKQGQIMQRLEALNNRILLAEELQTNYFALTIETLKREFHVESMLSHKMSLVDDTTKMVRTRYRDMLDYQKSKDELETYTLNAFAEWCVKPGDNSLTSLIEVLHDNLFGELEENGNDALFTMLVMRYEKDEDQICIENASPQQFAYDLYTKITLTEIKAYLMMEFSWMTLRHLGKGNFTLEMSLMRRKYHQRIEHSQKIMSGLIQRVGRVFWRCDPKNWELKLGKTYDQVTRLLQGYVENEVNLNAEQKCFQSCEDYTDVRLEGCFENELCTRQPKCNGRIHSCRFLNADLTACQSKNVTTADNQRRYDYIEYDGGRVIGEDFKKKECPTGGDRAESWSRWIFWRCNYCFCLCDEVGPQSDRYFNLRDTIADYHNNKIVTGARFIKHQRVFHLQLQQGELSPGGIINQSSLEWIPLESYDVSHVDIRNGYDYHMLSFDSRSVDLDEISVENDSLVVTGARFRVVAKHLNLEVRFSPFNYTTGRLIEPDTQSFWLANDKTAGHTDQPRQKLTLEDPQVSTKSLFSSIPLSKTNQYMDFESSSVDKDVAQSTVPFIDLQDVVPKVAVPLSGLGIYHKGRNGFGGFFAPKIITNYNSWRKFLTTKS